MQRGFSLVELSIVLVILGLLTGGVLAGQSLIRAAELRSVVSDLERYQSAVIAFRERYAELPGDMPHATEVWSSLGGDGYDTACQSQYASGPATCNGNGDGRISGNSMPYGEWFRLWQHLANAGLIEGQYTGRDGATPQGDPMASGFRKLGVNIPAGKIAKSYFIVSWNDVMSGDVDSFDRPSGHILFFGPAVLRPEEAWNIDAKQDDGKPAYGRVRAPKMNNTWYPNCTTANDSSADYSLTNRAQLCSLTLILDRR